jgi:hypothetical protein
MLEIRPEDLDSVARWHFAVGGLQTQRDTIELGSAIRLNRLKVFPTDAELSYGLSSPLVAGLMQHYGEALIRHELVIDAEQFDDPPRIPQTAGALLGALRIRTEAEIVCPAVCDTSWSLLRGVRPQQCIAYKVEAAMYDHAFAEPTLVADGDFDWVRRHAGKLVELTADERFETAIEALSTYMHAANGRMMAAQLWAGIEALFEVTYEISYRLPLLAALYLTPRGPGCRKLRNEVKQLYKDRGTVVHGGKVDEEKLRGHVSGVRKLLARLLGRMVEHGQIPSKEDFEDLTVMQNDN